MFGMIKKVHAHLLVFLYKSAAPHSIHSIPSIPFHPFHSIHDRQISHRTVSCLPRLPNCLHFVILISCLFNNVIYVLPLYITSFLVEVTKYHSNKCLYVCSLLYLLNTLLSFVQNLIHVLNTNFLLLYSTNYLYFTLLH